MKFVTSTFTHTGGREENQDYAGSKILGKTGCWVVADGLGGHGGGAVASKLAVEEVLRCFQAAPKLGVSELTAYIQAAQDLIVLKQKDSPALNAMRTTIVALAVDKDEALWAHVGDSRLYHFRNGTIVFQTKDHSVPQAMAAAGDIKASDIRFHEDRNRLLRSLGKDGEFRIQIEQETHGIEKKDAFLMCTDGFWEHVTETEMEIELSKSETPLRWLENMHKRLILRAEKDCDNYTAIAVFVE